MSVDGKAARVLACIFSQPRTDPGFTLDGARGL